MAKPVMIGVSGIRGIVGEGLTPELLVNFSAAVGTFYGRGRVMVGRDSRVTGEMVKQAVFSGLMAVGCDPVDLGICSTPTVQMAVQESDAVGGIVITASHNPVEWNALKLLSNEGMFLDARQGEKVKRIIDHHDFNYVKWDGIGKADVYGQATEDHINAVLQIRYVDLKGIRNRRFKVAYDCVNGAGGTIVPKLLEALGCIAYPLNQEPTGIFAHTPEPVPENLGDLCKHVLDSGAEIGFAVDPDVDRLAVVTEKGMPMGEEYTVTLATQFVLSKKKGPVCVNLSTTRAVEDVARNAGTEVTRTPVGEIHVAKKMKEINAVVGGEGNGGVILPEVHLGRDAPVAIALVLQALLEADRPISEIRADLPEYVMTKKKIEIAGSDPAKILEVLEKNHKNETLNKQDGIKIDRTEGWIHVRKSNTEPIIRVMTEAATKELSENLCEEFLREIKEISK